MTPVKENQMADLKSRILEKLKGPTLVGLATVTREGRPWVRYVMAAADTDLNIWFSTRLDSRKVEQIRNNSAVHLLAGVSTLETAESYVQVEGEADVLTDAVTRKALWNDLLKPYFSGPEDPNFCVVRIRPSRIELWGMTPGQRPEVWQP